MQRFRNALLPIPGVIGLDLGLQRIEILDAAHMLQQAEQNLQEKEAQLRERDERVSKYRREDSGLRFTITCLVAFSLFQAGLLIWIATR